MSCTPSKDTDQPVHSLRLIGDLWIDKKPTLLQADSDTDQTADVQADQSLLDAL